ncbi:MAG: hypothetical protein ACK5CA_03685 [Cyanobacteriota bacterium]|jgi:hypothetical protein
MNPRRRKNSPQKPLPPLFPPATLWLAPVILLLGSGAVVAGLGLWLATQSIAPLPVSPVVARAKRPQLFEIRGKHIYYLDAAAVQRQLTDFGRRLPICKPPPGKLLDTLRAQRYHLERLREFQACQREQNRELQTFRATTEFYRVRLQPGAPPALRYELAPSSQEDNPETLDSPQDAFRRRLEQFDPQTDYVAFIVRPDGFGAFRAARQIAQTQGFEVGWEPLNGADLLLLGTQGQTIGGL